MCLPCCSRPTKQDAPLQASQPLSSVHEALEKERKVAQEKAEKVFHGKDSKVSD